MTPLLAKKKRRAPATGTDLPLCDIVLDSVRTQVGTLREMDPLVRRARPESVVKMRVATRTLRSDLLGFHRIYVRAEVRPVAEQLKWLAAELADEGDNEMLLDRLTEALEIMPADAVLGPIQQDVAEALGGRSRTYGRSIHAALDSPRYAELWTSLDRLVADPPLRRKAHRAGWTQLADSLGRAAGLVDRGLTAAIELPPGPEADEYMHEARKAAKRLRSMTDTVLPEAGKPARRLRRRAKKLQDRLGFHQDSVVARPALRELGLSAHDRGHNAFTYGTIYGGAYVYSQQVHHELVEQREGLRLLWHRHWQRPGVDAALPLPSSRT